MYDFLRKHLKNAWYVSDFCTKNANFIKITGGISMIIGLMGIFFVLGIVFFFIGESTYEDKCFVAMCISFVLAGCIFIYGCFNGFTYFPPTEGVHQGIITAVDLEGKYFRRYEVYLKSSGYTTQSDETV